MLASDCSRTQEAEMATIDRNRSREALDDQEALRVLLDADIDKVMAGLDRIVEAAPSYQKLFSRWEKQQWNTESFDFSEDVRQWNGDVFTAEQRQFIEWSLSSFFLGEERVTTELLPFAIAAPSHEARAFLATQISDEAKHMVFFDRFYREVFGVDAATLTQNVEAQRGKARPEYEQLFDDILGDCADTLRKDPSDMNALVRGVTVYMVVIEGTLALTGARFIIRSLKDNDWLPGFRQGFTAVNRDESRHVGFGVKFLADSIKEDERYKQTVQDTLKETLPVGTLALAPPTVDDPYDFVTPFGYTSAEIYEYAMRSLSKKLAAMGMEPVGATA
jgi:ribonucleoside-diphosphate reductase beta chain